MSYARKCDVCGTFFELDSSIYKNEHNFLVFLVKHIGDNHTNRVEYDVCSDCYSEIKSTMERLKEQQSL